MSDENLNDNVQEEPTEEVVQESQDNEEREVFYDSDLANMSDEEFIKFVESGDDPTPISHEEAEQIEKSKNTPRNGSDFDSKPQKEESGTNTQTEQVSTESDVNYEDLYKQIMKPFKANGKDITPRNVEDVISLMQMGANYTKKMQLMTPMRKAVETLNKNDIKEDDLNFLIDVRNGDKEAIKQLLQKHKIDPMDLDLENIDYKGKNHIATDEEVSFAEILDDIKPNLTKIRDIMDTVWDSESKKKLLENPKMIRGLHEEIEMGRFEEIQAQVELEKTFGRYKGVSDLDAYIDIASKLTKQAIEQQQQEQYKTTAKKEAAKVNKAKAAPTRNKPTNNKATLTKADIFSMSDEEFNKLSINDIL